MLLLSASNAWAVWASPLVLIGVITFMVTGFAYFRFTAGKVWQQNAAAYQERVGLLEEQNTALSTKIIWLEARVHELEARPDWTQVVAVVRSSETNIIKAVESMRADAVAEATRIHLREQ